MIKWKHSYWERQIVSSTVGQMKEGKRGVYMKTTYSVSVLRLTKISDFPSCCFSSDCWKTFSLYFSCCFLSASLLLLYPPDTSVSVSFNTHHHHLLSFLSSTWISALLLRFLSFRPLTSSLPIHFFLPVSCPHPLISLSLRTYSLSCCSLPSCTVVSSEGDLYLVSSDRVSEYFVILFSL